MQILQRNSTENAAHSGDRSTNRGARSFHARRHGVTLLELILTIGAAGVLVLGLASALRMATLSIRPDATAATASEASAAIVRLQDELRFARRILSRTTNSVRMITTDADADQQEDLVEYTWSGVAGDPLLRRVNGGAFENVLDEVDLLDLTWQRTADRISTPQPATAGPEVLLDARDNPTTTDDFRVSGSRSVGQCFEPSQFSGVAFPTVDTQWRVTRIEILQSRSALLFSSTRLELQTSDEDGLPTDQSFGSFTVPNLLLSGSPSWQSYAFNMSQWLDQHEHLSLTATLASGLAGMDIRYDNGGGNGMISTSQSRSDWHRRSVRDGLLYRLYGQLRTPQHSETLTNVMRLDTAEIRLRIGENSAKEFLGACELLHRPLDERLHLESHVNRDPVMTDSDFSGSSDWTWQIYNGVTASSSFGPDHWSLTDVGLRSADQLPQGLPIDLRIAARDVTAADRPLMIRAAAQQSGGGGHVSVRAQLELAADGSQRVRIERETATSAFEVVGTYDSLDAGWTDLRILILPDQSTAALWINRQPADTFYVHGISNPQFPSAVSVAADGTTADVLALEVLVGESN